jgi:hypothetical protein
MALGRANRDLEEPLPALAFLLGFNNEDMSLTVVYKSHARQAV